MPTESELRLIETFNPSSRMCRFSSRVPKRLSILGVISIFFFIYVLGLASGPTSVDRDKLQRALVMRKAACRRAEKRASQLRVLFIRQEWVCCLGCTAGLRCSPEGESTSISGKSMLVSLGESINSCAVNGILMFLLRVTPSGLSFTGLLDAAVIAQDTKIGP